MLYGDGGGGDAIRGESASGWMRQVVVVVVAEKVVEGAMEALAIIRGLSLVPGAECLRERSRGRGCRLLSCACAKSGGESVEGGVAGRGSGCIAEEQWLWCRRGGEEMFRLG